MEISGYTCCYLLYRYYCGRSSFELAQLVLLVILIGCIIFLSPYLDGIRMSMLTVFFLGQFEPGFISLPIKRFPLNYDLNGFKYKVSKHLYLWVLSKQLPFMLFISSSSFFCNFLSCRGCSVLHGMNPHLKNETCENDN